MGAIIELESPKAYELAARSLFVEIMDWHQSNAVGPGSQQALLDLLREHFKRFDVYQQDTIERLFKLCNDLTDCHPAAREILARPQAGSTR